MSNNVADMAKEMLEEYVLCDRCLGRQFAQLLTNTTNEERGKSLKFVVAMDYESLEKELSLNCSFKDIAFRSKKISVDTQACECYLCMGLFDKLDEIVEHARTIVKDYEYSTFVFGVRLSGELVKREEEFWEKFGIAYAESLKDELTRELGKRFMEKTGKEPDLTNADISFLVDLSTNRITKSVRSLYIYGKYNKYAPMPQTKWICSNCKGIGCEKCEYTGKLYPESVEELIGEVVLKHTKGIDTKFHGAGREDIDALCYGWREFVIEVLEPKIRSIDLKVIEKEINELHKGKVEVKDLRLSDKKEMRKIKEKRDIKMYEADVVCDSEISDEDVAYLEESLKGKVIVQQTPLRVEHRRADKLRKRKIYDVKVLKHEGNRMTLYVKAEAGTYIKELVHGDEGRTRPSVSSILEKKCRVEQLRIVGFESTEGSS